jgi:hypothetical protein
MKMAFRKVGADEGKTLEVESSIVKLGSKVDCCRCHRKFAARDVEDFLSRICPACKREQPDDEN